MNQKLNITINAKKYDIDVDSDFAIFLQQQLQEDLEYYGNNELKVLLSAYIKKCHTLYEREKGINLLIDNIQTKI